MARKKKTSALEDLFEALIFIIANIIILIASLLKFIYEIITFYKSGYKIKSGNGFFKTYFNKGNKGEFILYRKIYKKFGKEFVFTNLYLDNVNTDKTEIDVLAISNKKIYVFEMKNYKGWIYGSEKNKEWTQVFNKWSKYKFYNPLRQNYAHAKALEKYLDIEESLIEQVVVFSNVSKLKKIDVRNKNNIMLLKDVNRYINKIEKENKENILIDNKQDYAKKLILVENVSEEIKQEHIRQVEGLRKPSIT